MTHLGFIGTGRMGGPMAMRLLDAGHELTVFTAMVKTVEEWAGVEVGG